mgnify:FL=1
MTYLYIFLVSATASIDTTHVAPIFKDVILLLILFSGIGMGLTIDNNRPDVDRKITFAYIVFSICASIFFSMLSIAAYIEFNFAKFYFYILIGSSAALAPQFARKILPEAPEELKKGAFGLLRAFFNGVAKKFDTTQNNEYEQKQQENETE